MVFHLEEKGQLLIRLGMGFNRLFLVEVEDFIKDNFLEDYSSRIFPGLDP